MIENLDERLININSKWMSHFNKILDRLSAILDKLEARTNKLSGEGKDTAEAKNAITIAKASIATGKSLVETQMNNNYPIDLNDEKLALAKYIGLTHALNAAEEKNLITSIKFSKLLMFTLLR